MNSIPRAQSRREPQLLYTRAQVGRMYGDRGISFVRRLERQGLLRPIRLSRSPTGMVFFKASDVHALIEETIDT